MNRQQVKTNAINYNYDSFGSLYCSCGAEISDFESFFTTDLCLDCERGYAEFERREAINEAWEDALGWDEDDSYYWDWYEDRYDERDYTPSVYWYSAWSWDMYHAWLKGYLI